MADGDTVGGVGGGAIGFHADERFGRQFSGNALLLHVVQHDGKLVVGHAAFLFHLERTVERYAHVERTLFAGFKTYDEHVVGL